MFNIVGFEQLVFNSDEPSHNTRGQNNTGKTKSCWLSKGIDLWNFSSNLISYCGTTLIFKTLLKSSSFSLYKQQVPIYVYLTNVNQSN